MAALATAPTAPDVPDVPDEDYFTVNEAAQKLRVGTRWLRDGYNHRGFPGARMSGRLIFSAADLTRIYEMHRVPARTAPRRRRAA